MTDDRPDRCLDPSADDTRVACSDSGCERDVAFRVYDRGRGHWRPLCHPHAEQLHPSLEIHVWLESGYMKPVELGTPDGPPGEPGHVRGVVFRDEVEKLMGWSESPTSTLCSVPDWWRRTEKR